MFMKKLVAFCLAMALVLPFLISVGPVAGAESYTEKPFYGVGWSDINRIKFPNLEGMITIGVSVDSKDELRIGFNGKRDPMEIAKSVKTLLDKMPEGMRYILLAGTANAMDWHVEDAIYLDAGTEKLKQLFTDFIEAFQSVGGQLDGLILDTEYVMMGNWYVYNSNYYQNGKIYNTNIYNEIVANPKYVTEIRPMLEDRGFVFWENPSGVKSEIYGIWPNLTGDEKKQYSSCPSIWNKVMDIRLNNYLNYAIFEPLHKCYPNAVASDYTVTDSFAWTKPISGANGGKNYIGGNTTKFGNASNQNTYSYSPADSFYKDSTDSYVYRNPISYNKANFEDDAYNMFMWDVNRFKNSYAATDTKRFNLWVAEYDYPTAREGSVANTPYYTEILLHAGMLDPEPFLVFMWSGADRFKGTNGPMVWNERMQVISEILNELTRVAGYSDRKPIETPVAWNDGFVLSGMYTGGRNLWRLTPDTTDGMPLVDFKIKDSDPTFAINGNTITFPGGKIIADGTVSVVGTCGYWIETSKDVTPVITRSANRYSEYPSFGENFEGYDVGFKFNGVTALPHNCWSANGTNPTVQAVNGGKALALTGTVEIKNVQLPKNITAGDNYAKQQAWEFSVILPQAMNDGANVKLLTCGTDGGIKLEGTRVYYDENGTYKELSGVTLQTGVKYTVRREVNFTVSDAFTCTYSVYNAEGQLLGRAENVSMKKAPLPLSSISFSCQNLTTQVMLDDYKLYPVGFVAELDIFNADNGIQQKDITAAFDRDVAYRLSWMNAGSSEERREVVAFFYDASGKMVSERVLKQVEMNPGWDGVETGVITLQQGQTVKVSTRTYAEPVQPPTTVPTTVPTVAPSTAPAVSEATAPVNTDRQGNSWVLPVVVIAVVVLGAVVAIFVVKKNKKA